MDIYGLSVDAFLDQLQLRGASANTSKAYKSDLDAFSRWVAAEGGPYDGMETAAATFLNERRQTHAAKTVNRYLTTLREFGKFHGMPSFLHNYIPPTPATAEPHPLPDGMDDVYRMIRAATTNQQKALIALCGMCGLRVEEAVNVTPDSIKVRDTGRVLKVRGKGDKVRNVPISTQAWDYMQRAVDSAALQGGPNARVVGVGNRGARAVISRLGRRAGVLRPVSSHDLRATFGTHAYETSKDLRAVQELMGHSSPNTTVTYTRVSEQTKREVVESL
jgi:integrase/recombinase XerD